MSIKRDKLKELSIRELLDLKLIAESRTIRRPIEPYNEITALEYKKWRNFHDLLQCISNILEERIENDFFE